MPFATAQDAEDAFYDALEAGDAATMAHVWADSAEIACVLPMTPLVTGTDVLRLWQSIFEQAGGFDIQVRHLLWIETDEMAAHLIEERTQDSAPGQTAPPIYGLNLFRKDPDGWRLILHQNSPSPPPLPGPTG
ncbi:ketosteroid isomerase [Thiocapsa imhoffii]|uniref:Ketosteroid isomerase n=1 Tax=Thiocapsa imhoffii TaxID=382777 RepID=A0A9X0WF54_9GAMM|nr:nuclear transport factor 2 family protein [Thiocapsa imhoffii]MBK1643448.1 ketosteroid isomerase [Thiocapsa imhoffii]